VKIAEKLPQLFSEVEVIGYPRGGTSVCVTKGVVSRVDAQMYAHASAKGIEGWCYNNPGKLLIVQVDAAINAGNSGGPALDSQGKVVGVASSGMGGSAQNIGYIIPCSLVLNMFDEFTRTGAWGGIPEPGIKFRTLECEALRNYLKMPEDATGVQLLSVAPQGALASHAEQGDVLLSIDGENISNEGTVLLKLACGQEVQVPFEHIITGKRQGETTSVAIWRPQEGPKSEVSVSFRPIDPLVQRFDVPQTFFVFGGLVFTPFTTPLMQEYFAKDSAVSLPSAVMEKAMLAWREQQEEVIVLLRVLKHKVNEGVRSSSMRILESVNGEKVGTMQELVRAAMSSVQSKKEFVCFGFLKYGREPGGIEIVEVLKSGEILEANEEILDEHAVPTAVSSDLSAIYEEFEDL